MSIILLKNNEAEPAETVVEAVSCTSDLPSHRLCHPIVIMLANIHSTPHPNEDLRLKNHSSSLLLYCFQLVIFASMIHVTILIGLHPINPLIGIMDLASMYGQDSPVGSLLSRISCEEIAHVIESP